MSNVIRLRTAPARAAVAASRTQDRPGADFMLLPTTAQPDRVDEFDFMIGRGPMQCGPNYDAAPPRTPWLLIVLNVVLWAPLMMAVSGGLS